MSVFDDEILTIRLNFKGDDDKLRSTQKIVGELGMQFDSAIRKALRMGEAISDIAGKTKDLASQMKNLQNSSEKGSATYEVAGRMGKEFNRYTPDRLKAMLEMTTQRHQKAGASNAMQLAFQKAGEHREKLLAESQNALSKLPKLMKVLVVDVDTSGKNTMEVHGRLVEYNRELKQFGRELGRHTARIQYDRRTLQAVQGASALATSQALAQLARNANIGVAHFAAPRLAKLESLVPGISGSVPWMDSANDIPWKLLGLPGRSLTSLADAHGMYSRKLEIARRIGGGRNTPLMSSVNNATALSPFNTLSNTLNPATTFNPSAFVRGHQTVGNVDRLVRLLDTSHRQSIGMQPYMSLMTAKMLGPSTHGEQLAAQMYDEASIKRQALLGQLRGSQRYVVNTDDPDPRFRGQITYKGLGPAQDTTPTNLGGMAHVLDQQKRMAEEFMRNILITHPDRLVAAYIAAAGSEERRAGSIGNFYLKQGSQPGQSVASSIRVAQRDTIMGEDRLDRIRLGVNYRLDDARLPHNRMRAAHSASIAPGADPFAFMASQGWAQPGPGIGNVSDFMGMLPNLAKNRANIGLAAQMANVAGPSSAHYAAITDWIFAAQAGGRQRRRQELRSGGSSIRRAAISPVDSDRPESPMQRIRRLAADAAAAANEAFSDAAKNLGASTNMGFGSIFDSFGKAFKRRRASYSGSSGSGPVGGFMGDLLSSVKTGYQQFTAPEVIVEQQQALDDRSVRMLTTLGRRRQGLTDRFDSSTSRVGMAEIDASIAAENARAVQAMKITRMMDSKKFREAYRTMPGGPEEYAKFLTEDPVQKAELRHERAVYARKMHEAQSPGDVRQARMDLARMYEVTRHGPETPEGSTPLYRQVLGALVGRSARQIQTGRLADIDSQAAAIIGGGGRRPPGPGGVGGRGGRGGAAGAGGMYDDFGSRGGMGWGIGAASLVAYGTALKSVIADSVIYAARTETLVNTTGHLATVNGLNTDQVANQVKRVKELNITTQEAHSTVQKMIFAQLDVAKATQLARTAQDAAILGNVNSSEALEKIILGITTGQTRLLHNMGLQVSLMQGVREIRAEKRAAGDKSEPTELEKRHKMLNKVLLEGAKIMGTYERAMLSAGKQFNSLQREVEETQNAVGGHFLPLFGQMVGQMSGGLGIMRENSKAVAEFAKVLFGLGAAATVVGTSSFIKFLMTTPMLPPQVKVGAALVGAAAYAYADQDPAKMLTNTAIEASGKIDVQVAKLRKERKQLWGVRNEKDPDWVNSWKVNTESLESFTRSQVGIQEDLTRKLADQYNERVKLLDDHIAALEGRKGTLMRIWAVTAGNPDDSLFDRAWDFFAESGAGMYGNAKRKRSNIQITSGLGISQEQIQKTAELKRLDDERMVLTSPSIINKEQVRLRSLVADMQHSQAQMHMMEEKQLETGSAGRRARMAMGSPTEKVLIDRDLEVEKLDKMTGTIRELRTKSAAGDKEAVGDMLRLTEAIGDGNFRLGAERMDKFMSSYGDIKKDIDENANIQLGKIGRQTQAHIVGIDESVEIGKIKSKVIEGNKKSELKAIQDIYDANVRTVNATGRLLNDPAQKQIGLKDAAAKRDLALIDVKANEDKAARQRIQSTVLGAADLKARQVLESPMDAEEAIRSAFQIQIKATREIENEQERYNRQLELSLKLTSDLSDLKRAEARLAAEGNVARAQIGADVQSEVDRIVRGKGRSSRERALDEISSGTERAVGMAEYRYQQLKPVTDSSQQGALSQQRDLEILQARAQGTVATIKQLDQQVEAARQRLADSYSMQYQRMERINELTAHNAADEEAAAYNTHIYRMELIEKEFQAAGESKDALAEKDKKIQDANFDHLQKLLEMRKREIEGVRTVAGQLFDSMYSGKQGVQDLGIGYAKSIGKQVFQNVAGIGLNNARTVLGSIIPGQETRDSKGKVTPTLLGRILGGTPFSPSHTEDIDKLMVEVTKENTTAEQELNIAIRSLDEAVRAVGGLPGSTISASGGAAGSVSGIAGLLRNVPGISRIPGASAGLSTMSDIGRLFGSTVIDPRTMGSGGMSGMLANAPGVVNIPASFGMPASMQAMMAEGELPNAAGVFSSTVTKGNKVPAWQQALTGFGGGATGHYNLFDVLSNKSSVRTGGSGSGAATAMSGAQRAGAIAGAAATVAGGAMQAFSGFKEGGARGIVGGIGGILTAASVIPGPQQPFVMAGALIAGFVSSIMKSKTADRQKEIEQVMKNTKFVAPVKIEAEMSAEGGLLSYDKYGRPRDTGVSSYPFMIQPNAYIPAKNDEQEDLYLPGRVLENTAVRNGITVNYYTTVPVNTMDSRSFMDNSKMVAAALQKELRGSTDMSITLQNAVFGV